MAFSIFLGSTAPSLCYCQTRTQNCVTKATWHAPFSSSYALSLHHVSLYEPPALEGHTSHSLHCLIYIKTIPWAMSPEVATNENRTVDTRNMQGFPDPAPFLYFPCLSNPRGAIRTGPLMYTTVWLSLMGITHACCMAWKLVWLFKLFMNKNS